MINKTNRIRKRGEYSYIYRKSKKIHTDYFTVFLINKSYDVKIGFSVSKKNIGKAVKRNLIKRRLSEIFRIRIPKMKKIRFVIQAKDEILNLTFAELSEKIDSVFTENNLYLN